jgi:hypothetical protein
LLRVLFRHTEFPEPQEKNQEKIMANFVRVQSQNRVGWYINVDQIRAAEPISTGTVIHFDKDHRVALSTKIEQIMVDLEFKKNA